MFGRSGTVLALLVAALVTACSTAPTPARGLEMIFRLECTDAGCPTPDDADLTADLVEQRLDPAYAVVPDPERTAIIVRGPEGGDREAVEAATAPLLLTIVPIPPGDPVPDAGATLSYPPLLAGSIFTRAAIVEDLNGSPAIDLTLHPDAVPRFADHTERNVGNFFAITLDGVAITVPEITQAIPGDTVQITGGGRPGGFSDDIAEAIVRAVQTGPLPFPLVEVPSD